MKNKKACEKLLCKCRKQLFTSARFSSRDIFYVYGVLMINILLLSMNEKRLFIYISAQYVCFHPQKKYLMLNAFQKQNEFVPGG